MNLSVGAIIWAVVSDPNGYVKDRPLVIVGVDDTYLASPLVCVAITTKDKTPRPTTYVRVPWDSAGKSQTGLKVKSFAVANWIVEVDRSAVRRRSGDLSGKTLRTLLARLHSLE